MAKKKSNQTPPAGANQPAAKTENKTVAASLQKIGEGVLERNPDLSAVYVTTDGNAFTALSDAANHSKTLKNGEVLTVEKSKQNE